MSNLNLLADAQAFELLQMAVPPDGGESALPAEALTKMVREGIAAWSRILDATRNAFDLAVFHLDDDGQDQGATDMEVMDLFQALLTFMDGVKKNTKFQPTLPPSTVVKS